MNQNNIPSNRIVLTCAFCGEEYLDGTPSSKHERLTEHIKQCREHPLNKIIAELKAQLETEREKFELLQESFKMHVDTCQQLFEANSRLINRLGEIT